MVSLYRKLEKDNPKGVTLSTHVQVARILRTTSDLCRRAWHRGWESTDRKTPTMLPIKDLIFREKVVARGKRNQLVKKLIDNRLKVIEAAEEDNAQSRALEGLAVRQLMAVGSELTANTYKMLLASAAVRDSVIKGMQQVADDPSTPISKRLSIMNTISEIAERDSKTLERAQTLERRFMGEIESRQKIEGNSASSTTPESVYDDLAGLFRALGLGSKKKLLTDEQAAPALTLEKQGAVYTVPSEGPALAQVVDGVQVRQRTEAEEVADLIEELTGERPTDDLPEQDTPGP